MESPLEVINSIENLWSILDAEIPLEKEFITLIFLEELKIRSILPACNSVYRVNDTNYIITRF